MREALYLLATLVLLPYVMLSVGFVLLGHASAGGTLFAFFDILFAGWVVLWLIPWGLLAFAAAVLALLALGLNDRLRWLGGLCLSLVACGCTATILFASTTTIIELGQLVRSCYYLHNDCVCRRVARRYGTPRSPISLKPVSSIRSQKRLRQ